MQIHWCDSCGTTKYVKFIIELGGDTYDLCEYCYKQLKNDLDRKKDNNIKKIQ